MEYMRHHYQATTPEGLAMADEFKSVAITEMKHAEKLAERIDFLGGDPTTKPAEIVITSTELADMAKGDLGSEEDAVRRYKAAIEQAAAAGDVTTRRLLEDILADEEDHVNTFQQMLGM
jgi:bacterioferritin